jgi:hypothetical protein
LCENILPKLSEEEKKLCECPLTLNDIKDAITDMKNGKSPGINVILYELF